MQGFKGVYRLYLGFVAASLATGVFAQGPAAAYGAPSAPSTQVYWGDTHLHTKLSADAYVSGNRALGLEEAYRFAKGETITAHSGMTAKINRPLDFLVIADHAEYMGVFEALVKQDPLVVQSAVGDQFSARLTAFHQQQGTDTPSTVAFYHRLLKEMFAAGDQVPAFTERLWERVIAKADEHNQPGKFTAFIGFEWSQLYYNLHRVVIFEDDATQAGTVRPYSLLDSNHPEDLWDFMAGYEANTGGNVLAIPHNGNLSTGVMFALEDSAGQPISADYAKTRARWEPLYEVTQTKGDGETHPVVSPLDAFADFETKGADYYLTPDMKGEYSGYDHWIAKNRAAHGDSTDWMRRYEYARSGLKLGLEVQREVGVNPFKFGMIGSTDSHTSMSAVDENNFWGISSIHEPYAGRATDRQFRLRNAGPPGWTMNAAGYAGVWATENTRAALFAAMQRKEVYASTGPRITLRFYGGWDFQAEDAYRPDLAAIGYAGGVPMGGDLTRAPKGKAPRFLIRAVKDPEGANLDRVQVVKGWHDGNGELREKIYAVALADGRRQNRQGEVTAVGSTVDIAAASYTNTIGDPELAVVWQDPDFNADELAFYYVRVLEIPTPRWTAYDAKHFGVAMPDEVPMVTQERAYSSPIWYTP